MLAEHYGRSLWTTLSLFHSPCLITLSVENSNVKPGSFDKLTRLNRSRLSHTYTREMKQHFHVPLPTWQLLRVSSYLYLSFAEWGNLLKKHDTELEEAINSAESACGWMADTLGSDNYPGLIRRGQGSGMPGRQISEFLQSQAQGSILHSSSRSAYQSHHPAPSHHFWHYLCVIYDQVSPLIHLNHTPHSTCQSGALASSMLFGRSPVFSIGLWWAMGYVENFQRSLAPILWNLDATRLSNGHIGLVNASGSWMALDFTF